MSSPPWYRISEITHADFVECIHPLYYVLEGKHESKTVADPFARTVLMNFEGLTEDDWTNMDRRRLYMKSVEDKLGNMHEELMGKFPGYVCMRVGDKTGCDVRNTDGSMVMEVKNRHNTMNSSSAKSVVEKLSKLADKGVNAILVQVNCPNEQVTRFGAPANIQVWTGKQAYAFLSGRESFFDDVLATLDYVTKNYKTIDALAAALGVEKPAEKPVAARKRAPPKCGNCREPGHTKPKCPKLTQETP